MGKSPLDAIDELASEQIVLFRKIYQFDCLRNEIDDITEDSVRHNNSPMTVHGQFQSIVKKIDEILDGVTVYGKDCYWATAREVR
jgi:hypothetical protein